MAVEAWETLKEEILTYTGLSPTTFFTLLALFVALYYVASGLFGSSDDRHSNRHLLVEEDETPPLRPPVQLGEITPEELKAYDGSDPEKPLLMAVKGQIYDVSQSRVFYGPGGPYALFAGKDASRALAKMSFEEKDLTADTSGLVPVTEPESIGEPSESTSRDIDADKPTEDGKPEHAAVKSDETPSNVDADKQALNWMPLLLWNRKLGIRNAQMTTKRKTGLRIIDRCAAA
ncbi:hypothetical protein Fmac_023575 [Flemingia macrophylla]|uniref:Cytochrome b5 heme-binding domain-containing protein n=1 Tax=Flemingia macrophylla TaxID=520843 RepID=A0ABD1LLX4_9FABA